VCLWSTLGKEGVTMDNARNYQKNSHTENERKNTNGERFKNVCQGIAAIGGIVLQYLQYFHK
jgi:hypothetical protein